MLEPPPTARITSGLNHLLFLYPCNTLSIEGFGFTSSYNSYLTFPSSRIFITLSVTPASTRDLSDTKNTLLYPLSFNSSSRTSLAPNPKYEVSFNINLVLAIIFYNQFYRPLAYNRFSSFSNFIISILFLFILAKSSK